MPERDRPENKDAPAIDVTPAMRDAALYELRGHTYGADIRAVITAVYIAMEIERLESGNELGGLRD